jgi:hypothetical protein
VHCPTGIEYGDAKYALILHSRCYHKNSMIRILFLTANPFGDEGSEPPLKLYREFESIDDKIQLSKHRNKFELIPRFSSSMYKLHEYILRFEPEILHFSGHGTTEGELVFQDEYGKSQIANANAIKDLFEILHGPMRCVVLNSCFSENQAKMISKYIDCVIGMANEIFDQAAIVFATNFYYGLGSGLNVRDAYQLGKNQVVLLPAKDHEGKSVDVMKQSKMIRLISKRNTDCSKLVFVRKRGLKRK